MYKAAVRAMIRHGVKRLNGGDPEFFLRMAAPDAFIAYPGDNSWATMFHPLVKRATVHPTHRGIAECRAFAERFVDNGVQFDVEDILVNGPPWNTRIALRVVSYIPGADGRPGSGPYTNRAVALLHSRWGRLLGWEDYEDTERVAAWDAATLSRPPLDAN